ncbi:MAG: dethiobiotin synthase [Sumerlaeia bacterium]
MTLMDLMDEHPIYSTKALFVTGTDTDIGKTYITRLLIKGFQQREIPVFGIKPIITGFQRNRTQMLQDDCEIIKEACLSIKPTYYTPLLRQYVGGPIEAYKESMAPVSAARLEGRRFHWQPVQDLLKTILDDCTFESVVPVVEGVGGPLVPLGKNYFVADIISELKLDAVLVTRTALGTISHTLTALESLQKRGVNVISVIASRATTTGELNPVERSSLEELIEQLPPEMPFYLVQQGGSELVPVQWILDQLARKV